MTTTASNCLNAFNRLRRGIRHFGYGLLVLVMCGQNALTQPAQAQNVIPGIYPQDEPYVGPSRQAPGAQETGPQGAGPQRPNDMAPAYSGQIYAPQAYSEMPDCSALPQPRMIVGNNLGPAFRSSIYQVTTAVPGPIGGPCGRPATIPGSANLQGYPLRSYPMQTYPAYGMNNQDAGAQPMALYHRHDGLWMMWHQTGPNYGQGHWEVLPIRR